MADELPKPEKPYYAPSILASAETKATKEYSLRVARALYFSNWNSFNNAYGNFDRNRFLENRAFSEGRFDVYAFMGGKRNKNNRDKNPFLKHLDFDPISVQPKYRDIVVGFLEDLDYEITATAQNPAVKQDKENRKYREIALLRDRAFNQQVNQAVGAKIMPESSMGQDFQTEDDVNLWFSLSGYQETAELEIELADQIVNNDSDWKAIKKLLLEDAFDTGRMALDIEYDNKTKRFRKKHVYPEDCGIEYYRGHKMNRPSKVWYIDYMSVEELISEAGDQFTMKEIEDIAHRFENKYGNPSWMNSYNSNVPYANTDYAYNMFWTNWKVPVMKFYYGTLDDVSGAKIHRYYQGRWIINTDYIYNYGLVPYQVRDPQDMRYALCPFKYYRVCQQPLAERIKPLVKKIFMAYLHIDQEVANKIPDGYEINYTALENLSLGEGPKFTIKQQIEMGNETGRWFKKTDAVGDEYGRFRQVELIKPLDFSSAFARSLEAWNNYIELNEQRIMKLTGINEFMDATNPNPDTPATAAKLAAQGTKHSMSQIASGLFNIAEKSAIDVSDKVWQVVEQQGEYNGYADALGDGSVEFVRISREATKSKYSIKVEAKPTADDRRRMKEYIQQAFANMASPEQGGLWATDALYFEQKVDAGVDMKIIRLMMEQRIKRNLATIQKQKMEAITAQGEQNSRLQQEGIQLKIQEYVQGRMADLQFEKGFTPEVIKRENAKAVSHTESNVIKDNNKTKNNIEEAQIEAAK